MIFDSLKNIENYYCLSPQIDIALKNINAKNSFFLEPTVQAIDDNIKLTYSHYETVAPTSRRWSAHENEIEIHIIEDGSELLGFVPREEMTYVEKHSTKDILYFEGEGNWLRLQAGQFLIVFPNDVHIPKIIDKQSCLVKKSVYKITV